MRKNNEQNTTHTHTSRSDTMENSQKYLILISDYMFSLFLDLSLSICLSISKSKLKCTNSIFSSFFSCLAIKSLNGEKRRTNCYEHRGSFIAKCKLYLPVSMHLFNYKAHWTINYSVLSCSLTVNLTPISFVSMKF